MKRVLYLNTLNIRPLPRTKQHKTTEMKTKEEILNEQGLQIGFKSTYSWDAILDAMDEYASQFQQEWIPVEEETAREPIQDALYATGRFTKDECDVLSDGILRYINDANLVITPQPYNPTTK
mgnify:FL=1